MLSSHGLKSCSSNSVNNPPERPEFVLRVSNVNKKCSELAGHSLNYRALCSQEWAKKELYTILVYGTPSFNSEPRWFSPCIYMNYEQIGCTDCLFFLREPAHRTDNWPKAPYRSSRGLLPDMKRKPKESTVPTFWKLCLGVTSDRWSPKIEFDGCCLTLYFSADAWEYWSCFHFVLSLK